MKSTPSFARLRRAALLPLILAGSLAMAQEGTVSFCNGGDADGDGVPDCIEPREALNPAVKDNDIFSSSRLFAMQQYRDFFAREGDASGVDYWSAQISKSSMSRAETVAQFIDALETGTSAAAVTRLYFAFFQRVPDYGGLRFWIDHAAAGNSLAEIAEAFAGSDEFRARYDSKGNREFVELVYQNVLARAGDTGGLDYWTSQLDQGALSRGELMLRFTEQQEFRELTRNETLVTLAYVSMLRRAPDPEGFAAWLSYLDGGSSGVSFIGHVLDAPEYRSRFLG